MRFATLPSCGCLQWSSCSLPIVASTCALAEQAATLGFAGLMVDTGDKSTGSLLRRADPDVLRAFLAVARRHGRLCGVAGSLARRRRGPAAAIGAGLSPAFAERYATATGAAGSIRTGCAGCAALLARAVRSLSPGRSGAAAACAARVSSSSSRSIAWRALDVTRQNSASTTPSAACAAGRGRAGSRTT